jgi:hypothetical protein
MLSLVRVLNSYPEMRLVADARRRETHLLRLLVHPFGELRPSLCRHVVVVGDQVGDVGERRDRLEVLQRLIGLLQPERDVGRERRRAGSKV